jgi:hypothetical protein
MTLWRASEADAIKGRGMSDSRRAAAKDSAESVG